VATFHDCIVEGAMPVLEAIGLMPPNLAMMFSAMFMYPLYDSFAHLQTVFSHRHNFFLCAVFSVAISAKQSYITFINRDTPSPADGGLRMDRTEQLGDFDKWCDAGMPGDRYVQRSINQLFDSYADASLAFRVALNTALDALASVSPVSVEDQDNLILQTRDTLDSLFHDAAMRLGTKHNVDGLEVLARSRQQHLFYGEAEAKARWDKKWAAIKAEADTPTLKSKPDFASASIIAAGLTGGKEAL